MSVLPCSNSLRQLWRVKAQCQFHNHVLRVWGRFHQIWNMQAKMCTIILKIMKNVHYNIPEPKVTSNPKILSLPSYEKNKSQKSAYLKRWKPEEVMLTIYQLLTLASNMLNLLVNTDSTIPPRNLWETPVFSHCFETEKTNKKIWVLICGQSYCDSYSTITSSMAGNTLLWGPHHPIPFSSLMPLSTLLCPFSLSLSILVPRVMESFI